MSNMFCFQCEQTAGGKGCMGKMGVCGKQDHTANLQDELTGALITLGQAAQRQTPGSSTHKTMLEGLFATITNVNFDDESLRRIVEQTHRATALLNAECGCKDDGTCKADYAMAGI